MVINRSLLFAGSSADKGGSEFTARNPVNLALLEARRLFGEEASSFNYQPGQDRIQADAHRSFVATDSIVISFHLTATACLIRVYEYNPHSNTTSLNVTHTPKPLEATTVWIHYCDVGSGTGSSLSKMDPFLRTIYLLSS